MFTVFNEKEEKYQLVEEPDPSLSYTYADYLQWNFEERLELIRGRIFKMSGPNTKHQIISLRLTLKIATFLQNNCQLFVAPFDVRLPVKNRKKDHEVTTVVQPDLCVICDESKIDERGCCGAPDLMVEILSPGNTRKEMRIKLKLYEESGVKEYWIISQVKESATVFVLDETGRYADGKIFTKGDRLSSNTIPGLEFNTDDIFT